MAIHMPDNLADYIVDFATYWQAEHGSAARHIAELGPTGLVRAFLRDPRFSWRLWGYLNPPDRLGVEERVRAGLARVAPDAVDLAPQLVTALLTAARERRKTAALVLALLGVLVLLVLVLVSD